VFGALLLTSVVVLRVERVLYIQSHHLQFLPDLRLSGYENDSLTIRPIKMQNPSLLAEGAFGVGEIEVSLVMDVHKELTNSCG